MTMTKFERRKHELARRFEEEMKALQDAEKKEIEKKIDPIVLKIGKLAEEEARRIIEAEPEILEFFSFKKREIGKALRDALEAIFKADKPAEDLSDENDEDAVEAESGGLKSNSDPLEVPANESTESVEPSDPFADGFQQHAIEGGSIEESTQGGHDEGRDAGQSGEKKGFMGFGIGN